MDVRRFFLRDYFQDLGCINIGTDIGVKMHGKTEGKERNRWKRDGKSRVYVTLDRRDSVFHAILSRNEVVNRV